jgi:hypothetical protein
MTYDFFDRISGSTHWPSSDPNDSPVDTFKCKKCGYTFSMMMYGSFQAGYTPPQEHAEQKMLAHIAMFHRDVLGREPLTFAEAKYYPVDVIVTWAKGKITESDIRNVDRTASVFISLLEETGCKEEAEEIQKHYEKVMGK